ncbi:NusG domain II-containing protein [Sinimarinibacterium sp. NLF-5-8]|uniref:NusG domain II-containing protein n=1 Tax=Sinimarinibacterium sp. NLF-5-8 TaxID=2698684 RepID=UPI00137C2FAD|nr:NusG domain II-containing protein [Sinimarinibacterium sp. NLF-5-8]QHS09504.1 NusG domain II-containing protein [Sinimarinibacterium sp. NLF-5-8]
MSTGRFAALTHGDIAVVLMAAALIGALFAHLWQPRSPASFVEVRVGSQAPQRYALDRAQTLTVGGKQGAITLAIEPGRARFVHAPCRNQICVHSGWLSHSGDSAACLPGRVSLSLVGDARQALDAVTF